MFAQHYVDGSTPKVEEIITVSSPADIRPQARHFFQLHMFTSQREVFETSFEATFRLVSAARALSASLSCAQ